MLRRCEEHQVQGLGGGTGARGGRAGAVSGICMNPRSRFAPSTCRWCCFTGGPSSNGEGTSVLCTWRTVSLSTPASACRKTGGTWAARSSMARAEGVLTSQPLAVAHTRPTLSPSSAGVGRGKATLANYIERRAWRRQLVRAATAAAATVSVPSAEAKSWSRPPRKALSLLAAQLSACAALKPVK